MDDALKLLGYMDDCGIDLADVSLDDLHGFAAAMGDLGIAPRSQARIISGVKSLFRFLSLDGYRQDDPSELLEAPKIGRHLPDVLTVAEIDSIIGQINLSLPEGQRNRAMIETMYSCGLRVSELCSLRMEDLFLDEGFIRVTGKGSKQRLVPISQRAIDEIGKWLMDRCHVDIKPGDSIYLGPYIYHAFYAVEEDGDLIVGEVSRCNDDANDNHFNPHVEFQKIEEDAPIRHLLCGGYQQ